MANPKSSTLKAPSAKRANFKKPHTEAASNGSKLSLISSDSLSPEFIPSGAAGTMPVASVAQAIDDPRQRGLMLGSLCLLLLALSIVVWHERDFWFPDTSEADVLEPADVPPSKAAPATTASHSAAQALTPTVKSKRAGRRTIASAVSTAPPAASTNAAPNSPTSAPSNSGPVVNRTVLPPLEVEVVAGDSHRTVHPGSNSIRVDLQPGSKPQTAPENNASASSNPTAASVTNNAAEHVQISANTAAAVVSNSVQPSYPLLARQMKVQGSVILQALIGRDGVIQNLKLLSGPRILATAAEDAVRQWHFKPHYEGNEAVETQAKITVNFTISTN